jgi:hypothetical protein
MDLDLYLKNLEDIADKLASGKMTPQQAASQLTNGQDPLPSDEDIEKVGKELEKSLEPEKLPVSDKNINDLLCTYTGEELGNRILWEISKSLNFLRGIREIPDFSTNESFDRFFQSKNLAEKLERAKEILSDNLDIDLLGIKIKGANLKKRSLKIGPFSFPIHVITSRGTPLFYHIPAPKLSTKSILDKLKKKAKKPKKCIKDYNSKYGSNSEIDDDEIIKILERLSEREESLRSAGNGDPSKPKDVYDIVDDIFCEPDIPIDPETGETLFSKDDLTSFLKEICEPPAETQIEIPEDEEEKTEDVADLVNECLGQAKGIFKDNREKNEKKLRLEKAEKELEEILYYYTIIKDYYNSLYFNFVNKVVVGRKILDLIYFKKNPKANNYAITQDGRVFSEYKVKKEDNILNIQTDFNKSFNLYLPPVSDFRVPVGTSGTAGTINNGTSGTSEVNTKLEEKFYYIKNIGLGDIIVQGNKDEKIDGQSPMIVKPGGFLTIKIKEDGWDLSKDNASDSNLESVRILLRDYYEYLNPFRISVTTGGIYNREQEAKALLGEAAKVNYFPDVRYSDIQSVLKSKEFKDLSAAVNNFSARLRGSKGVIPTTSRFTEDYKGSYFGLQFEIEFPHGVGEALPYEDVKIDIPGSTYVESYQKIDIAKLKVGMEFSADGVLGGKNKDFFNSYKKFVNFKNRNPKMNTDFYNFFLSIEQTNLSKNQIISNIERDHGFLFSHLIEASASSWLFFTGDERGDNDARKIADLKPKKSVDGEPNKEFTDFWNDYKKFWDSKYISRKEDVKKRIQQIKDFSNKFNNRLSDYYFIINPSSIEDSSSLLKDASDSADLRVNKIQELLLFIAEEIKILDQENSPEKLQEKALQIKCAVSDKKGDSVGIKCPSECCGPSGQAINSGGFGGFSDSPDCPSIFTVCYWKEFCKYLNRVNILPFPNGIPPIEKPSGFLPNIGLKYWPVGYLPPSFIPLPPPIVNPLDGLPFIRIPLPMNWTKLDPILIPLPVGLIVIFIPLIGGFMPSPLVFFHDFLTGNSIFLLGIRGFRFIPRKSDPILKDPRERFKINVSRGIPHFAFPFSNLGGDNVDSPKRIQKEITENIEKQLANLNKNVDFSEIQKLQDEISTKKRDLGNKILEAKRRAALTGESTKETEDELKRYLKSVQNQKINLVKKSISDYLKKIVDVPDITFPKKSTNLIAEIPGSVKLAKNIKDKKKIGTIPKPSLINLKSKILGGLKDLEIPQDPKFLEQNKSLSPDSKIVASFNVPLSEIKNNVEEFNKLSSTILGGIGNFLNSEKSPLNPKVLGLFTTKLNPIPKNGKEIPTPGLVSPIQNGILNNLNSHLTKNLKVSASEIEKLAKRMNITENSVLRDKDLKVMMKNTLSKTLNSFPVDLKKFPLSNIATPESITGAFNSLLGSIEAPPFPPKKSGTSAVPIGIGGIPQIIIPGKAVSSFLVSGVNNILSSLDFEKIIPGGLDNFESLTDLDIKNISSSIITKFSKNNLPPIISSIPPIPLKSRPQDMIEFSMQFLPVHPFSDIAFTIIWNMIKLPPRVPITASFLEKFIQIQNLIFSKLPWPIVVLMGRWLINMLNPLYNREDLPRWDRMTLKNPMFVVFLDEFLRSAADISGGFKFFIGAGKLLYPLPDLEISLGFGTKIGVN